MTSCENNCMKFKRRSLSITKTIKYSINQASRNIFLKFHECSFIMFYCFSSYFCETERIRIYDTEKTQVKMTWFLGTWFISITKGDSLKGLSNFKKKKKKKKKNGRGSETVYNYLLSGVPRSTRPAHSFVMVMKIFWPRIILFRWAFVSWCRKNFH